MNPASGLALAWVNSYSGTVIKTSGATLLFDPVSLAVPDDVSLDLIAISHGHTDHWDQPLVTALHQRTQAVVATSPYLASKLTNLAPHAFDASSTVARRGEKPLPGSVVALEPGEWLRVGDVTVAALRCDHAAEEPLSFLVRTDEDLVVYLPGDSTPFPAMTRLPVVPHPRSFASKDGDGEQTGMHVDVLLWMGTALDDGARIARIVQPKVLVSYAIAPPAAGVRARGLLTRLTPSIPLHTLENHQVFVYPPEPDTNP